MPVHHEQRSEPSGSRQVDVGVDSETMPEQQDNAHGDEGRRERALNIAQQPDGGSQNGSDRCGGVSPSRRNRLQRMNPPPTHRAPSPEAARPSPAPGPNRQPPRRPPLHARAADPGAMHAVAAGAAARAQTRHPLQQRTIECFPSLLMRFLSGAVWAVYTRCDGNDHIAAAPLAPVLGQHSAPPLASRG